MGPHGKWYPNKKGGDYVVCFSTRKIQARVTGK